MGQTEWVEGPTLAHGLHFGHLCSRWSRLLGSVLQYFFLLRSIRRFSTGHLVWGLGKILCPMNHSVFIWLDALNCYHAESIHLEKPEPYDNLFSF